MIGKTFNHKHITTMTCTIIEETNKGYKVAQCDTTWKKGKPVTKFYNRPDLIGDKALWIEKK